MKRLRLYIETSAWNFLFVEDAPHRRAATEEFFSRATAGEFEMFSSELVISEMAATTDPERRRLLLEAVKKRRPVELEMTSEVEALAERYVLQGTIPEKYLDDALHVAVAVVHGVDAVVSWNLRHLVKMKTRREVNALNRLNGFGDIEIVTPEEVL